MKMESRYDSRSYLVHVGVAHIPNFASASMQLALRPLIATPSEPPRYPQTEVFIIEAAKE